MCLCLAIGAVAFNGESVNLVEAREDFRCDEKGYVEYLSKWSVAEKSTSRDVRVRSSRSVWATSLSPARRSTSGIR